MPHDTFSAEYKAIRDILQSETFTDALQKPMEDIKRILGATAPDAAQYSKLDFMRTVTFKMKEVDRILAGAGLAADGTTAPTEKQAKLIAAIKFLRHFYLINIKGSQALWVHSTPKGFTKFPYDEVMEAKASLAAVKGVLAKTDERFDTTTKEHLAEATQLGLAWCQKTSIVLGSPKTPKNKEKIERWFAPAGADFDAVVSKLNDGFKKITNLLNSNHVIVTDKPHDRTNPAKNLVEAYVKAAIETPRTIYVEKAMFENYEISVLHDMKKNWTRILVHECSHLESGTDDKGGYAFRGIKPVDRVTPERAANNADSWAFFAADCGGSLVENEINRALNGTGGTLTKLAKNWA